MSKGKKRSETYINTVDEEYIFNAIDNELSNLDRNTLLEIQKELKEQNEDTKLIDKALIKNENQEQITKEENKGILLPTLFGMFLRHTDNTKRKYKQRNNFKSLEQEEVKKGNYDSWNFEEDELEEDDYYYEDD